MKTYDEALELIHFRAGDEAAAHIAVDRVERGFDLSKEIMECPRTFAMIRAIMVALGSSPDCDCRTCEFVFSVAMSTYLNGVRIGIEMEKQEFQA